MIPKKLDVINRDDHAERFLHAAGIEDTFEIRNKINEIIGYIQAKEEAKHKQCNGWGCEECNQTGYEASKGECKHSWDTSGGICQLCGITYRESREELRPNPPDAWDIAVPVNPPEHKCDHKTNYFMNAVNGCKVCSKKAQKALSRDGDPEHEERLNGFNELLDSLGYIPVQPNQTMKEHEEKNREILQDYIQANFVSKEKIKNLATQMGMRSSAKIVQLKTLNRLQIEDIIYDKILESLGLGD